MGTGEGLGGEGTCGTMGMGDRGGREEPEEAAVGCGEAQRPPGKPPTPWRWRENSLRGEPASVRRTNETVQG